MDKISFDPIGVIHTSFKESAGTPIQSSLGHDNEGYIELLPEFSDGLKDLEGFSHIILLFYFHFSKGYSMHVKPYLDNEKRGVFSTRAPRRPNPIGMTIVKLERIEGNRIFISDLDILDSTPLLDIKPYVPKFDKRDNVKIGWLEGKIKDGAKDDGRFSDE